jgi:hypothetical protein
VGALPASGSFSVEPVSDFVPLCNGWLLYGDRDGYRAVAREAASGRLGLSVPLAGSPRAFELDSEAKLLYVALSPDAAVAVVDLVSGDVETIDLPASAQLLSLGNNGDLWLVIYYGGHDYLFRLPGDGGPLQGSWLVTGIDWVLYNRARDEIITGGFGSSNYLRRFAWNGASLVELETNHYPGSGGNDVALSPDGQHLAYACNSYAGEPATTDWSTADVGVLLGVFQPGAPAEAVAFGPASGRVAIGTETALSIWDATSYTELDSLPLPWCNSGLTAGAGISRGGGLMFAQQDCGYQHTASVFHWLRVD